MIVITVRHFFNQHIYISAANGIHSAQTGFNRNEREGHIKDDPGQTHSANSCPEQRWVLFGTNFVKGSISQHQCQAPYMVTETSLNMVILAMNI